MYLKLQGKIKTGISWIMKDLKRYKTTFTIRPIRLTFPLFPSSFALAPVSRYFSSRCSKASRTVEGAPGVDDDAGVGTGCLGGELVACG